ncbi:MAG: cyclopropane-fatty-acyl-phospholipid synthase, partial [Proteobacteria bacterium]|nr:cyclopropane-fatty-acyl-phospholipid synthase [Pseudomonadota bacterium]
LHYAKTLKAWRSRFDASHHQVTQQFDENFTRAWRLYLAGSEAAFLSGALQLFQVVFTRERNNNLAVSRTHLYS